jgi:hypothetical protein
MTLGIWAVQLGFLLFAAVDHTFPNPAAAQMDVTLVTRNMAGGLASIIVAFPLFLLVTWGIVRGIQQQPERLESSVRKWLTYIALVITASIMIGDVVTFLTYLLRGDLNTRFVLKVLTVLVIAGGVFAYYLDSQHRDGISPARNRWFAIVAVAIVGFGIFVGFMQIGSPSVQRSASQDTRRLYDLSSLAQGMHIRWLRRGEKQFELPATIQDLQATAVGVGTRISDPVSGRIYRYAPLQGTTYRLCATFSHVGPPDLQYQWRHSAGDVCFTLDASENSEMVQPAL